MYHRYMRNEQGQYQRKAVYAEKPTPPQKKENGPPAPPLLPEKRHEEKGRPSAADRDKAASAPAPDFQLPFLTKLFPGMDQGDLLLLLIMILLISEGNEDASDLVLTLGIFLFLQ